MIEGLVDHLERHLGTIRGGWQNEPDGSPFPFQLVEFEGEAPEGCVVYGTLGLSEFELDSPVSDSKYRIEQIMIVKEKLRGPIPEILLDTGRAMIERGQVAIIGDLFCNILPLREVSSMGTLYVGRPLFHPLEFHGFSNGAVGVSFSWLIPVSGPEADYIRQEGSRAFEKLMYDHDIDPTDLDRESMLP